MKKKPRLSSLYPKDRLLEGLSHGLIMIKDDAEIMNSSWKLPKIWLNYPL